MALLSTAVNRLRRLASAVRPSTIERSATDLDSLSQAAAAITREAIGVRESVNAMVTQVADARRRAEELLAAHRAYVDERAQLAAIGGARLRSDSIILDGTPSARLRVKRVTAGERVELPFRQWMGITRCVSGATDVREAWQRLLTLEASGTDGMLRGGPSTILDVPDATASKATAPALSVQLQSEPHRTGASGDNERRSRAYTTVAIPRFTYAFPSRKLRNFSHWLLDCVPQVVALANIDRDSVILVPPIDKAYHLATLSLLGIGTNRVVVWTGEPIASERVLILESDGRAGGGRPLSTLRELRRLLAPATGTSYQRRRIYVSRRDAKRKRRWLSNEPEVEALFESRGFEVLCIAEHPFHEVVRRFRDAEIVAGINGAGLAHILFSPPGTHVIVLFSDSLIRWHADETGARSLWASDHAPGGELSALGDSPRFYAHLAAVFEQYCHSFVAGDDVRLDQLRTFLDDVLSQTDRA
jgi:capsular polysaccharide biosynthesis protein